MTPTQRKKLRRNPVGRAAKRPNADQERAEPGSIVSPLGRGTGAAGLLASPALARLVVHFLLHPDSALHLRALRRHTGLGGRSLTLELDRLSAFGLVRRVESGRRVLFVAEREHPAWSPLWHLARYSIGAADTLRDALADMESIGAAFVHGSMVRGDSRPDSDIDLFVVGDAVNPVLLAEATMAAGSLLGREVNVTLYRPSELAERGAEGEGFVPVVLAGAKAWVIGTDATLSALLADVSPTLKRKRV